MFLLFFISQVYVIMNALVAVSSILIYVVLFSHIQFDWLDSTSFVIVCIWKTSKAT